MTGSYYTILIRHTLTNLLTIDRDKSIATHAHEGRERNKRPTIWIHVRSLMSKIRTFQWFLVILLRFQVPEIWSPTTSGNSVMNIIKDSLIAPISVTMNMVLSYSIIPTTLLQKTPNTLIRPSLFWHSVSATVQHFSSPSFTVAFCSRSFPALRNDNYTHMYIYMTTVV